MTRFLEPYSFSSFGAARKLLEVFGFWRQKNSSKWKLHGCVLLHLLFIDISLLLQLVYIFKLNDVAGVSHLLQMSLTFLALFLKSINFVWRFNRIAKLENSLGDLIRLNTCEWQFRSEHLDPHVKRVARIFNILWYSSLASIVLGAVAIVYNRSERQLMDKMWIPFDYQSSESRFLFVAFYQVFGAMYACSVNSACDIYPIFHLCVLKTVVDDLGSQLNNVATHDDLRRLVQMHRKVKECSVDIQNIFSPVILAQGVCSSIIFCTTAFSLSTVSTIKMPSAILMQIRNRRRCHSQPTVPSFFGFSSTCCRCCCKYFCRANL